MYTVVHKNLCPILESSFQLIWPETAFMLQEHVALGSSLLWAPDSAYAEYGFVRGVLVNNFYSVYMSLLVLVVCIVSVCC